MAAANVPLFKDVGKTLSDLMKFEHNKEVKVKTITQSGITFESTGQAEAAGGIVGLFKASYKNATFGTFEEEFSTSGKSKATWKNSSLIKGLTAKLSITEKPSGTLDLDYQTDVFSGTSCFDVAGKTNSIGAAAMVGFEGLSTGGEIKFDTATQKLSDYNGAAEYAQKDFTVSLKTKNSADVVDLSYLHKANSDLQVGGLFSYAFSGTRSFSGIFQYNVDAATSVKVAASSAGLISTFVEQKLAKPQLKYAFSAEFNAKAASPTVPSQFGISLGFGEY